MNRFFSVALGGSVGAVLRYSVQNWALGRLGAAFPYGTLLVNVTGGFLIGLLMTVFLHHVHISPVWRVFLVTGVLGGFTTFSALAWESYALFSKGEVLSSLLYTGGSFFGGMLALSMGVFLGRMI
jgi:CrcB protein